jgi:hypothetical protein
MNLEYDSQGYTYFEMSEDDIYFQFKKLLKEKLDVSNLTYDSGFDSGKGFFIKDEINVSVRYIGGLGFEMFIPATLPPDQIDKVRGWAELIREGLKSQA